jgi:hypothetical protein
MSAALIIYAQTNSRQTGIVITDQTLWGTVTPGTISSLTSVSVNVYGASAITPEYVKSLTSLQLDTFKTTGSIELLFIDLAGSTMLTDGWYTIKITANSLAYVSNTTGFGIYADITHAVYSKINSLHVPEEIKYSAEKYCIYAMFLEGLRFLDTSTVVNRDIKFKKRLLSLQKMLLIL